MAAIRQVEHDVNEIKKLGQEYFQAANAGDTQRCMATMAPDVVVIPPNRPSIFGIDELRRLSSEYHGSYEVEYRLTYDEVHVLGDLAFARSTAVGTRRSRSGANSETMNWRNVWILKREHSGGWKFWRIIFNSTLPSH